MAHTNEVPDQLDYSALNTVLRHLLNGGSPNGMPPEAFDEYREIVELLLQAYAGGGPPQVRECEDSMATNTNLWRKRGLLIESVGLRQTKQIIDKIDRILLKHYRFTNEELNFIINYDVKFRVGQADPESDDE